MLFLLSHSIPEDQNTKMNVGLCNASLARLTAQLTLRFAVALKASSVFPLDLLLLHNPTFSVSLTMTSVLLDSGEATYRVSQFATLLICSRKK